LRTELFYKAYDKNYRLYIFEEKAFLNGNIFIGKINRNEFCSYKIISMVELQINLED